MSHTSRTTRVTIDRQSSRSRSHATDDDEQLHDSQDDHEDTSEHSTTSESNEENEDEWDGVGDDIDPSDSASASADQTSSSRSHRAAPGRSAPRHHRLPPQQPRQHQFYAPTVPPMQAMSSEGSDEYYYGASRAYPQQPMPQNGFYGGGRGYPQSHVGGYGAPAQHPGYPNGQVVPYGGYSNPFSPMPQPNGPGYFPSDVGVYNPGYTQAPYYPSPGFSGVPPHIQQYMYGAPAPPPPPPTEPPSRAKTPAAAAPPPPNPELEALKAQLELLQIEKGKSDAAAKQAERDALLKKDAEAAFQRRLEDIRVAQEQAKKDIEAAKKDAERAAREKMEAAKKAEEEATKLHEERMQRAERELRDKIENERKADEERKKREAEAAALAEQAARLKIEAQLKAEADAKEAAEKKAKDEAEWKKRLEEEAKLKAEIEARTKIENELKKAEEDKAAAAAKKKEEDDFKKKALEEAKAKAEEAVKKAEGDHIVFKDALGRKYQFPFALCQTWRAMDELIQQAFAQVEAIGPQVKAGHYDLIGPSGEIILPTVWDKVIKPGWNISMLVWPPEKIPGRAQAQDSDLPPQIRARLAQLPAEQRARWINAYRAQQAAGGRPAPGGRQPPMPPGFTGAYRPPGGGSGAPAGVHVVDAKPKKRSGPTVASFFGVKTSSKSSKKKSK